MNNEQPKAGKPGEISQWPRWEGPAETRPSGYLQGEANIFAEKTSQNDPSGSTDADRPDHLLAQAVRAKLNEDALLDPTNITVTVHGGEVVLEGYVAQPGDRERAQEFALLVKGVRSCTNRLRLAPDRH